MIRRCGAVRMICWLVSFYKLALVAITARGQIRYTIKTTSTRQRDNESKTMTTKLFSATNAGRLPKPAFNVNTKAAADCGVEALERAAQGLTCTTAVNICYGYRIKANDAVAA